MRRFALVRAGVATLAALTVAGGVYAQAPEAPPDPASMSPVQLLLTVKRLYRRCTSYRDTGTVSTSGSIEGGRFSSELPFSTAFVRGGAFRFQFTDEGLGERSSLFIVWSDGNLVRAWWDAQPGVREPSSLVEALQTAAGASADASIRIPGMLLPASIGEGVFLSDPERIDGATDRGVSCIRLRGRQRETPYTLSGGSSPVTVEDEHATLWFDRSSLLLRRVEVNRKLTTYRTVITTSYDPQMNVAIPAAALAFDPPQRPPTPAPSAAPPPTGSH